MATVPAGPRKDLDLEYYRGMLEEERARLTNEIRKLSAQDETGGTSGEIGELANYDQHMADQATELFLREQDQAIQAGLVGELRKVDTAWQKLENGTYGYCDRCGIEIPQERLEILPFALYCIRCADDLEARI